MHKLTNRLDYAVGVDADHGHNVLVETDGSELVGVTELLEGAALTGFNNNLGNGRTETADYVVDLNRDYTASILNSL